MVKVDLDKHYCECGEWMVRKRPCCHAVIFQSRFHFSLNRRSLANKLYWATTGWWEGGGKVGGLFLGGAFIYSFVYFY